jgi:SNF2 family DNA or RNA helicase
MLSDTDIFYKMMSRADKIKKLPYEELPRYEYKMKPLGEYQHRGVVLLTEVPRVPMFADCGLGKTYMVLNSIQNHIRTGVIPPGKTLIVAKLATLKSGWLEDALKFTDLKVTNLWLKQSSKKKEKTLELLSAPADAYLINHDGLRVFEEELTAKHFQRVIVDESTILKGFHGTFEKIKGGQFGRALLNVSHAANWRTIMSGTPAPNGPEDLWGQFHFLDPSGLLLEKNFYEFRSLYMREIRLGQSGRVKYENKPDTMVNVGNLIRPLTYRLRIRDHLDLPPLMTMKRSIQMAKEQAKHYESISEFLLTEINKVEVYTPIDLVKLMKLRQVTGGFLIDNAEKTHPFEDNPKLDELDSILTDEIRREDKVVIYAQYRWEIETILNRYKDHGIVSVYGGNTSTTNIENIRLFREDPKVRLIVLHPKSAAHGITFTMAHYMIFYSISYSAEDDYQCRKRIERAGQKHSMVVFYLLAEDTLDEIIYDVINNKNYNQQQLIDTDIVQQWRSTHGKSRKARSI